MDEILLSYQALPVPLKVVLWMLGILFVIAIIKRLVKVAILVTILIILIVVLRAMMAAAP